MSSTTTVEGSRPLSLSARLTLWYSVSAFVVVLGVTGYLYWALATNLLAEDEQLLADQVIILRVLLRDRPDDSTALRQEVEWESGAREHARIYLRILDAAGKLVMESPGMAEDLPADLFPRPVPFQQQPTFGAAVRTAPGKTLRLMAAEAALGSAAPETRVIQAALDVTSMERLLGGIRQGILPALAVSLLACAWIGYRIARRGIRPMEEMTSAAREIRSSTLSDRLPLAGLPAELRALALTFNEMLSRLEDSFVRLQQFSADLAHELRTPIGNLRGEVEVALGMPRSPGEYREVLNSCLEECAHLSRMIDCLLFLARAEDPKSEVRRERVDLGRELEAVREFYGAAAEETGIVLGVEVEGGLEADLDRPLFQRALGNLVENALRHTSRGGRVEVSAVRDDGFLRVEVRDTGCGIAPEHLSRVFDRFYRVDRSRTRTPAGGGTGLGLAIVKSIADLHGGSARIESAPGRGTTVTLSFPAKN